MSAEWKDERREGGNEEGSRREGKKGKTTTGREGGREEEHWERVLGRAKSERNIVVPPHLLFQFTMSILTQKPVVFALLRIRISLYTYQCEYFILCKAIYLFISGGNKVICGLSTEI